MSRLSIRQRLEAIAAPTAIAGLNFGQGRLTFVQLNRAHGAWHGLTAEEVALPTLDFRRPPAPEAGNVIIEALRRLVPNARTTYLPLQVTLPDPLGTIGTLELDTLPKASATRRELVRWHFEKDLHLNAAEYEFDHQDLGMSGKTHLLFGQALDKLWLDVIRHALHEAGLRVWSLNISFSRCFNIYYPMITAEHIGAGLITLAADAWSFGFFDTQGRVRFVRSRWRQKEAQRSESFAAEIESTVRSYVHGGKDRNIGQLYLVGDEQDTASLAEGLNSRLDSPCVRLTAKTEMPDVPARFFTDAQFTLAALVRAA